MTDEPTYTAFAGDRLLASGAKADVLRAVKAREGRPERVLVFEDATVPAEGSWGRFCLKRPLSFKALCRRYST